MYDFRPVGHVIGRLIIVLGASMLAPLLLDVADDNGNAEVNVHAMGVMLEEGENSIMGKAVIVHAGEDDMTTQPTGDAGARLACGVIQ